MTNNEQQHVVNKYFENKIGQKKKKIRDPNRWRYGIDEQNKEGRN